jgi:hypothetical protein
MKPLNNSNVTGTTGEHFVCAELGKLGIIGLLTPKSNPLFDIVAVNENATKYAFIQVKTMSEGNKMGWKLNKQITKKKNNPNLFLILVNIKKDATNDFYIYKYDEFVDRVNKVYELYIKTPKRDGNKRKEVGFRWFDFKNFEDEDRKKLNKWELLEF